MDYSPEQWARMRENAVRTAFDMQRRAQTHQPLGDMPKAQRQNQLRQGIPNRSAAVSPARPAAHETAHGDLPQFYRAAYGVERYAGPVGAAVAQPMPPPKAAPKAPVAAPLPQKSAPQRHTAPRQAVAARQNQPANRRNEFPQSSAPKPAFADMQTRADYGTAQKSRIPSSEQRAAPRRAPAPPPSAHEQDDTRFLLMLILLLREEGADGTLIAMLMYILM
ncbi:MAG: hypothetical protein LBT21_07560 [Oscillospiraceae bacterium]|jgi:hypothetical protein|nr:hypothetical protein [Oscillospiraceae bacterium]